MESTARMNETSDLVRDEHENEWEVLALDGRFGILQREDSQRYYGALWVEDGRGTLYGTVYTRTDKTEEQLVNTVWVFTEMGGWSEAD